MPRVIRAPQARAAQSGAAVLETHYTLNEAARLLGIDLKTLRKKLQALGITPEVDANDKRARLLSGEQFDSVARHLQQSRMALSDLAVSGGRSLDIVALEIVKARELELDRRAAELRQRELEFQVRMNEIERVLVKVAATPIDELTELLRKVSPKLDQLLAEQGGSDRQVAAAPDMSGPSLPTALTEATAPSRQPRRGASEQREPVGR